MISLFKELRKMHGAFFTLINVDIKTTVTSTRLGWLWWILHPLVNASIYYFFVSIIMGRGGDNYHLFVLTGIVSWSFFASALNGSTSSIVNNKNIMMQVAIRPEIIVLVPPVVQLFFGSIGISIVMLWNYTAIGIHTISLLPLLLLISLTSYGFGLFLSVSNVYLRDTKEIVGYILRAGFFLSPVLYPVSRITDSDKIPQLIKFIFEFNPIAWVITALRTVLLDGSLYSFQEYFLITLFVLAIIQIGLSYLRANANQAFKRL